VRFLPKSALSMAASIVVGIAAVGVAPGPAFAQVVNDPIAAVKNVAEQTSAAEMDVLRDAVTSPMEATASGQRTALAQNGVAITLPALSSDSIRLGAEGNPQVGLTLPFASESSEATVDPSGAVSFDNENGSQTVVVGKSAGAVQVATVISNKNAPQRYEYTFDVEGEAQLIADPQTGAVIVTDQSGVPIAQVAAPWAVDAEGRDVATSYEISGGTLTQVVDLDAQPVTYPVVADPQTLYFWWGQAMKFSKSETKQVANAANAGYASLLSAFCGLIASGPGAVTCGVVSGALILAFGNQFKSAAAAGKCIQINMPYAGVVIGGPLTWSLHTVTC